MNPSKIAYLFFQELRTPRLNQHKILRRQNIIALAKTTSLALFNKDETAELVTAIRSVRVTAEAEKRKARTFARQQKATERIAAATTQLSSGITEAT